MAASASGTQLEVQKLSIRRSAFVPVCSQNPSHHVPLSEDATGSIKSGQDDEHEAELKSLTPNSDTFRASLHIQVHDYDTDSVNPQPTKNSHMSGQETSSVCPQSFSGTSSYTPEQNDDQKILNAKQQQQSSMMCEDDVMHPQLTSQHQNYLDKKALTASEQPAIPEKHEAQDITECTNTNEVFTPDAEEPDAAPVTLPKEEVCMDTDLWHYMCKVQSHELKNIKSEYNVNIIAQESGNITTVSEGCVCITVIETLHTYLSKLNISSLHV